MSSTSNVQNLLVNVFRPVYTYDATTSNFTPKIELSNIDVVSGNSLAVFTAAVGDTNSNMYVGSNAGNSYTNLRGCSNSVALGVGAGNLISNVSNSVYVGFNAGTGAIGASANVVIGANTNGNGSSNIYIGTGTGSVGSSNILIGQAITPGNVSNQLRIGLGTKPITIAGDLSDSWVGIGGTLKAYDSNNKLDVSGNAYVFGNLGVNITPGFRTMDVNGNFRADDGIGTLDFSNGVTSSEGGFSSLRGTVASAAIGSTTNIATLKKGVITVSAQDTANSTTHYDSVTVYCSDATNGTYTFPMTTTIQSGDVSIVFQAGGSNIRISNATSVRSINWSVSYFPLT